jgi:hypothetical protein
LGSRFRTKKSSEWSSHKVYARLPDFSSYKIPKRGKNIPNDHKLY